jgi:hypothetical protein
VAEVVEDGRADEGGKVFDVADPAGDEEER